MKRIPFLFVLTLFFLWTITSSGIAQTDALNVLGKMIEARGGAEKLSKIRTSITEGKIIMVSQGGVSGDVKITRVFPDKTLIEMNFMGTLITQGFDGDIAWMENPLAGGFAELSAAERRRMKWDAVGDNALLNPEKYGIKYVYAGKGGDAGVEYHVLQQVFEDGVQVSMYVDVESYLVSKIIITDGSSEQTLEEEYYSEYRDTDGIIQAHQISVFVDGQETVTYVFDRIAYNADIEEDIFQAAEERFTREELIADARQLAALIEETHPDPYKHIGGKIAFHRHLQHLLHTIAEQGMTKREFMVLVRPFVAAIGDAHTEVYAYHNVNMALPGGIPLKFDIVEQSLVVTGVPGEQYRHCIGALLISVEDVSIEELGRRLKHIRPIDNQYHLLWHFTTNYLWYSDYLQELLPEWKDTDQLRIKLQLSSGERAEVVFDLPINASSLLGSESKITLPVSQRSGFVYDFLGSDKRMAYLCIDHMKYYRESFEARNSLGLENTPQEELDSIPSATEFFRSMVTAMKDAGTEALIIDIRKNSGGDALLSDIMMYFLYGKQKTLQTRWNNISKLSKMYLEAREGLPLEDLNKDRTLPLVEGDYDFSEDYSDNVLGDASAMEKGFAHTPTFYKEWESEDYEGYYCPENIIVLTKPWTFSAGFGVAVRFYRTGAILIGTPSGQAPNSGANAIKWTLRNTGITGRVSQSYATNFPDDSELSRVLPVQHPMTYELFASYDFDPNAEVLYAIQLLSEMANQRK
jgi:hypothetical protein